MPRDHSNHQDTLTLFSLSLFMRLGALRTDAFQALKILVVENQVWQSMWDKQHSNKVFQNQPSVSGFKISLQQKMDFGVDVLSDPVGPLKGTDGLKLPLLDCEMGLIEA
ncbi:unnamed protein product [Larinioides sclopetarius]|uniref:Uncharacterized protein n=1 Tax=Larinioides sclopetarius TaxID=280406 RepID=A0AAV2AR18_9ARAC